MRIKSEFILREVAGESILIPTGEAAKRLSGLIALNESARFLYEKLKTERTEEELVRAMLDEYDVDEAAAKADVKEFLELLRKHQMLA